MSHDLLYNLYELAFQLKFADQKGDPKDFITHITVHPRQVIPQPLLDSLNLLLKIQNHPTVMHYDTVFNVGDYYVLH